MDKNYHFFAMASRMKYINRWGLMRNTKVENVQQHSLETAMLAHGLAVIHNCYFGGKLSPERTACIAMFHDVSEILTGDLPTPIKYHSPAMIQAYKGIEEEAKGQLLEKLPSEMRGAYQDIFFAENAGDDTINRLVKAADKLSAYIKCIEEERAGNQDFAKAKQSILKSIKEMKLPEAEYFLEKFLPAFLLTVDEI